MQIKWNRTQNKDSHAVRRTEHGHTTLAENATLWQNEGKKMKEKNRLTVKQPQYLFTAHSRCL